MSNKESWATNEFFNLLSKEDSNGLGEYLKNHHINEEIQGNTLLYWAVFQNKIEFVKQLVEKGAEVNKKDKIGRTPIYTGCFYGYIDIVKYLLTIPEIDVSSCIERAERGWDGNIQEEILKLLQSYKSCEE